MKIVINKKILSGLMILCLINAWLHIYHYLFDARGNVKVCKLWHLWLSILLADSYTCFNAAAL